MKQEDKDLLLKDICTRLPYNPMVEYKGETYNVLGITHGRLFICKPFISCIFDKHPLVEKVKPYLFPLSSMSIKQRQELDTIVRKKIYREINYHECIKQMIDFYNKYHFDFRGLI